MLDVLNLALPFFGLIFLGLLVGKLKLGIPETGLAWMGFFLIYLALPCLFYRVLALTPLEELSNPRFILGTVLATVTAFALAFGIGWAFRRNMAEATIAGLSGAYGNIGYMGPGLALATLGPAANVPVALIWISTAVLVAALPPALNVFIMARQYNAQVLQASGSVLLGTFVSVVTLTTVMWLVKTGALPLTLFR